MKKTIFGKWGLMRLVLLTAIIPTLYVGCGKTGMTPTSANDSVLNRNATADVVASVSASAITATAGDAWVNTAFSAQTNDFTATFNATVSANPANAIVALSNGAQTAYADFAALVRFNPSGDIDAYNGSAYAGPTTAIPYKAGTIYSFTVLVHMASSTYDVSVSSAGGAAQTIGKGLKFRAAASSLNNYGAYVSTDGGSGTLTVSGFTVSPVGTPTSTPTFTNTFTVTSTPTFTNTSTATSTFTITNTPTVTNTFTKTATPTNTFTKTATPVPPTATPTSQPTLNINFSQWYLQEPSGSGNSPTTRSNSWLEAGNSDTYFYTAKDGWKAYVDVNPGITTSGSEHPRCEMHEETTWGTSGTNTMTVTGKITQIDGDTTTIGQIFNNNEGTLIEMQYSKSAGQFKVFYEEVKGSGSYPSQTYVSWPMNTTYTYKLSLTDGVAQVTINGQVVFTHTLSSSVSGDQFYFKAGNYDQSATGTTISSDVSTTPYSIVEIGSAVIVHQ